MTIFLCVIVLSSIDVVAQAIESQAFYEAINPLEQGEIIDVRTSKEFQSGHIPDAINVDWRREDFMTMMSTISVSTPIFIYCLSGARSAAAAEKLRSTGYKNVVELKGGLLQWRNANLSETVVQSSEGMSVESYRDSLALSSYVLVDFYAEWCAPCKKMAPYLKQIAAERKEDDFSLFRIDADRHQLLAQELKVEVLPRLLLYHNGKVVWEHNGYIGHEALLEHLP